VLFYCIVFIVLSCLAL